MNLANLALVTAVVLSLVYFGLAIAAFKYMKPGSRAREITRLLAFSFWWPFYDSYETPAKPFRIVGVAVLMGCVVAYIAWAKAS
jgi:hypothetical protein